MPDSDDSEWDCEREKEDERKREKGYCVFLAFGEHNGIGLNFLSLRAWIRYKSINMFMSVSVPISIFIFVPA